ncbi:FlgO family outer membrane protein [Lacimicrobium sp. SS2-24]|uniref:FlgO family outer membrane protein n=1 Tax=Lacimicrobium sp. SS2-24 TaxID=2005569 RepID=UPI000B4A9A3B|nr:FlgO family outer membrane protein [Lacimicrobium sp. SS2-24]
MYRMLRYFPLLALVQGCSLTLDTPWLSAQQAETDTMQKPHVEQPRPVNGIWYQPPPSEQHTAVEPSMSLMAAKDNGYQAGYIHKTLNDYAEQLAMGLVHSLAEPSAQGRVAVGSFVELDTSLTTTSVLGNQLAEKLVAQLQEFGLAVVDIKTMPVIEVGRDGDRVFSRDVRNLSRKQQLDYVVSGTLIRNSRGIQINSRMVSLKDQQVVASASGFIPRVVADSLVPMMVQL